MKILKIIIPFLFQIQISFISLGQDTLYSKIDSLPFENKNLIDCTKDYQSKVIEHFGDESFYHPGVKESCFSSDEKILVSGSYSSAKIWEVKSGKLLKEFFFKVKDMSFNKDNSLLFILTSGSLLFIDKNWNIINTLAVNQGVAFRLSKNNKIVLITKTDSIFHIDIKTKAVLKKFKFSRCKDIFVFSHYNFDFSPTGNFLVFPTKRCDDNLNCNVYTIIDTETNTIIDELTICNIAFVKFISDNEVVFVCFDLIIRYKIDKIQKFKTHLLKNKNKAIVPYKMKCIANYRYEYNFNEIPIHSIEHIKNDIFLICMSRKVFLINFKKNRGDNPLLIDVKKMVLQEFV